jgi:hypothetical protein
MDEKPDREELIKVLEDYGWPREKAIAFLDDRVGTRQLTIPALALLDVLKEACQEGVPDGPTVVTFLVPESNWTSFRERIERIMVKHRGFVLDSEQSRRKSPDPRKLN